MTATAETTTKTTVPQVLGKGLGTLLGFGAKTLKQTPSFLGKAAGAVASAGRASGKGFVEGWKATYK